LETTRLKPEEKKMIAKSMRYALGLMVMIMTCLAWADENILFENFERWRDDSQWTVEGRAFGASEQGNSGITGYQSDHFMYSAGNGGEDSKGVITSQPFEIKRNYINFLIGGGGFEGQTCMNLIVGGEIVRTATGPNTKEGGTKAMAWHGWDVRKLKGKKARLQIVDNREGLWGYIAVDYIYQSNDAMKPVRNLTRNFKLEKKYLNFPINHASPVQVARLLIDGKIVREFRINLAEGKPEFWVYLEIDDFKGEKATLHIDQLNAKNTKGFDAVFQADTFPGQEELYKEKRRPQFHFTTKRGWVNDTNGLVYYDGEYHLFYQHGPFSCAGAEHNQTWGHAVSTDLIHWTELGKTRLDSGSAANRRLYSYTPVPVVSINGRKANHIHRALPTVTIAAGPLRSTKEIPYRNTSSGAIATPRLSGLIKHRSGSSCWNSKKPSGSSPRKTSKSGTCRVTWRMVRFMTARNYSNFLWTATRITPCGSSMTGRLNISVVISMARNTPPRPN
jgi:hypothetical protein